MYRMVPELRQSGCNILFFMTECKHSEVASILAVQETFIQGVSTQKLSRNLEVKNISRSQVREMTKGLNKQIGAFHSRFLS